MPFSFNDQITIEKTPGYFRNVDVPKRVFEMNPKIKLILIICEPVRRTISHYAHLLSKISSYFGGLNRTFEEEILDNNGNVQIENQSLNITEFLKILPKENKTINMLVHNRDLNFRKAIITDSMYVVHLKRWLKYFSLQQFFFVNGGELIANPYNELKKVENFLQIEQFFRPEYFVLDSLKKFYCINGKILNSEKNKCLQKSKGREHPTISPTTINKLKEFLKPYNHELFDILKQEPFWTI